MNDDRRKSQEASNPGRRLEDRGDDFEPLFQPITELQAEEIGVQRKILRTLRSWKRTTLWIALIITVWFLISMAERI